MKHKSFNYALKAVMKNICSIVLLVFISSFFVHTVYFSINNDVVENDFSILPEGETSDVTEEIVNFNDKNFHNTEYISKKVLSTLMIFPDYTELITTNHSQTLKRPPKI